MEYNLFLLSSDSNTLRQLSDELDSYFSTGERIGYTCFVLNNKDLFDKISNYDFVEYYNSGNISYGEAFARELFPKLLGQKIETYFGQLEDLDFRNYDNYINDKENEYTVFFRNHQVNSYENWKVLVFH